jgi:hypothetical protein
MIDLIQANFTPGKVKRIIGEEPSEQFYSKNFGRYDAVVEEGLNTSTQRQMQFAQLLQLREVGVPVPDDVLLEACTIQNKKDLTDRVTQLQQQQAQQVQLQQQLQAAELQSRIELAHSRSIADRGLGMERASRIQENEALAVERRAEAQKDREIGLLNLVKALKEIDQVDIDQLEKLLQLSRVMEVEKNISQSPNIA